jgi:hypothetical protein
VGGSSLSCPPDAHHQNQAGLGSGCFNASTLTQNRNHLTSIRASLGTTGSGVSFPVVFFIRSAGAEPGFVSRAVVDRMTRQGDEAAS